MQPVVLKLFARQDTGRMDRQTKRGIYASSFGEYNKITVDVNKVKQSNNAYF